MKEFALCCFSILQCAWLGSLGWGQGVFGEHEEDPEGAGQVAEAPSLHLQREGVVSGARDSALLGSRGHTGVGDYMGAEGGFFSSLDRGLNTFSV